MINGRPSLLLAMLALIPATLTAQRAQVKVLYGGSSDADSDLSYVTHIAIDDRGIVVVDTQNRRITLLGHGGQVIRSWGRQGSGPGEFSSPRRVGSSGDSIWIGDEGARRFTHFDRNGRVLRVTAHRPAAGAVPPLVLLHSGLAYAVSSVPHAQNDAAGPIESLLLVTLDGHVRDTLASQSIAHRRWSMADPASRRGGQLHSANPLATGVIVDATSDGRTIAWVTYSVRPAEITVNVFDVVAGRTKRFTLPYESKPVPAALLSEVVDRKVRQLRAFQGSPYRSIPESRLRQSARAGLTHPEHLQPVTAIVVAQDGGSVLLRRDVRIGDDITWEAYDLNGRRTRRFTLPVRAEMWEAKGDTLWGVLTDSLEVPAIIRVTARAATAR